MLGAEGAHGRIDLLQRGDELRESELRQGARPAELENFTH
jgi:hypothetical protein